MRLSTDPATDAALETFAGAVRITAVEAIPFAVPYRRQPKFASGSVSSADNVLVRVHTDAGLTGIGEVTSQSYVCKAIFEAPRAAQRRHGLGYILKGQDPADVEGLWQRMSCVWARTKPSSRWNHAVIAACGVFCGLMTTSRPSSSSIGSPSSSPSSTSLSYSRR